MAGLIRTGEAVVVRRVSPVRGFRTSPMHFPIPWAGTAVGISQSLAIAHRNRGTGHGIN